MKQFVTLNNGQPMPIIGFGCWQSSKPGMENILDQALKLGYRHFDTPCHYQNTHALGNALNKWLEEGQVGREELFIVSKIPMIGMRPADVELYLKKSLQQLQLKYLDLCLIHDPIGNMFGRFVVDHVTGPVALWKAMERMVEKGLVKSIGLSNFTYTQIIDIIRNAEIKPVVIQVAYHASFQRKLCNLCAKRNIVVTAHVPYVPLGYFDLKQLYESMGLKFEVPSILSNPVVQLVAENHHKTPAQILLHLLTQQGIAVITKSADMATQKENFEILDFNLTPTEVAAMEHIDMTEKNRMFLFNDMPSFSTDMLEVEDHPEGPNRSAPF